MDPDKAERLYEAYELVIDTLELNEIVLHEREEKVLAAIISTYETDPSIKDVFSIAGRSLDKLLLRPEDETLH